jgi:hypothetical protein
MSGSRNFSPEVVSLVTASARNGLAPRGGLAFDGTASTRVYSTLTGQAIGTDAFSVSEMVRIPTSVPAIADGLVALASSATDATAVASSFLVCLQSSGALRVQINNATNNGGIYVDLLGVQSAYSGKTTLITVVRSGATVAVYINGVVQALPAYITYGTSPGDFSQSITSTYLQVGFISSALVLRTPIYSASLYNLALSQADVTEIYELGGAVPERFKFGSQVGLITGDNSTFASNTGFWGLLGVPVAAIGGGVATIGSLSYIQVSSALTLNRAYRATVNIASIASGGIVFDGGPVSAVFGTVGVKAYEFVATATRLNIGSGVGGTSATIDDVTLVRLGAVVHIPFTEGAGLTAYDTSTNALNATLTATGVTWVLPPSKIVQVVDGTAAAPSISFAAQTNMGFYRIGVGDLGVSVLGAYSFIFGGGGTLYGANGTARLTMPVSGSIGLVAAGTAQNITLSPSGTGQVSHIGLSNFSDTLFFGNPSGSYGRITWGSALTFQAGAGLPFTLVSSNGTEVARGFANGRFGIGTGATDSGALLQVGTDATTTNAGGIVLGTGIFLFRSAANVLTLQASSGTACAGGFVSNLFTNGSGATMFFGTSTADSVVLRTNNTAALTLDASQTATFSAAAGATFVAKFNHVAGTNPVALLQEGGVSKAQWSSFSGDVYFDSLTAAKSVVFRSGAQVTALTLDGNQNATFAAAVTHSSVTGLGLTATSSTWAALGVGTTARSSLRIGHGVAPTSPVDGDMWTTTAGAFIRINGVTKTFTLI